MLWRAFLRTGMPQFANCIFTTLDGILFGGIYDHVGGGFFRHALDERWMEPAFEKMLYDQAQMIDICTSIWQFNRNELCRQRVAETIAFLLRDMQVGDAFAASISSGSQTEDGEILHLERGGDRRRPGGHLLGALQAGLWHHPRRQCAGPQSARAGWAIPCPPMTPTRRFWPSSATCCWRRAPSARRRPATTRMLADWNGLAIAALARAGKVFEKPEWIEAAIKAFDAVVATLGEDGNTLSPHGQGVARHGRRLCRHGARRAAACGK